VHWTCSKHNGETGLCLESEQAEYFHEAPHILHLRVTRTTLWLRDLDPYTSWLEKNWIPSIYVANDASCTSAGTSSCPTMKFCIVPACSTSHTSSVNEDWTSLVMSPDFEAMFRQTRSSESVPRRGMVNGLHRSGDEPAADHLPSGFTRSTVTRVYQWPRTCCLRRTNRSRERSQWREAPAERYASWLIDIHQCHFSITQSKSWYSFYHLTEARRQSWPRYSSNGWNLCQHPKLYSVYLSSCCHNHTTVHGASQFSDLTHHSWAYYCHTTVTQKSLRYTLTYSLTYTMVSHDKNLQNECKKFRRQKDRETYERFDVL